MRFRFADFEVDEEAFALRHGGEPIEIAPLPLRLLIHLLRCHPTAPSKNELLETLWPDTVVGEASLSKAVRQARAALGEGASDEGVLRTVRGRGFRIGVPVVAVDPDLGDAEAAPRVTLFGRDAELAACDRARAASEQGSLQALLLAGEPGIGKTGLAEEVAARAAAEGALALFGRCSELAGAPAYWPWSQILGDYAARRDEAVLRRELGRAATLVADVVPEIGERLGLSEAPERTPSPQDRFRFFEGVARFVRRASEERLLLFVFDDLHWADEPSLLLLTFLVREAAAARLLLVVTYRDVELVPGSPCEQALAALARTQRVATTLELGGLDRAAIGQLVGSDLGREASDAFVDEVLERTGGNPFFAHELARGETTGAAVPAGVQQVISRRMGDLPTACGALLRCAAVVGREADVPLLALAVDTTPAEALAALEPAERARLVRVEPGAGRVRFAHDLIRETLLSGLAAHERTAWHARVAQALERQHGAHPDPVLSELATHHAASLPVGDPARAVHWAMQAAEQDMRRLAFEPAAEHAALALDGVDRGDASLAPARAGALDLQAEALFRAGRREAALSARWRQVEVARATDDAEQLARAAIGIATAHVLTAGKQGDVARLLRDALRTLGRGRPGLRAQALCWLARQLTWSDEAEDPVALTQQAVDLAQEAEDPDTLAEVLGARGSILEMGGTDADRTQTYEALLRLGRERGAPHFEADALSLRLQHRMELGDPVGIDRDLETCADLAEASAHPFHRAHLARSRAMRALWRGDLDEAERRVGEAAALGAEVDADHAGLVASAQLGALRRLQARSEEIEAGARAAAEAHPAMLSFRCGLAAIALDAGREDEARETLLRLARRGFADLRPRDPNLALQLALLAEVAVALGEAEAAEALAPWLDAYAGRVLSVPNVLTVGAADRHRGAIAGLIGDPDAGEAHLTQAIEIERRMEAGPWLAHALVDRARIRRARGRDDAQADLAEAKALADQGRWPGLARRVERVASERTPA